MLNVTVHECSLTDRSLVYDVIVTDLHQNEGEDRIRFNISDERTADIFSGDLLELFRKHGLI